jgi:hypothetical protein
MISSKIKTQKNLSALIALALAITTLLQAGLAKSSEPETDYNAMKIATVLSEVDTTIMEEKNTALIEEVYEDFEAEQVDYVKVFNADNQLISEGIPSENDELRRLVNKADFLAVSANQKYYRIQ